VALLLGCQGAARSPPTEQSGQLDSLIGRGEAGYRAGEYDSAAMFLTRALALSRERGDFEAEAGILTSLGSVAYRQDDFPAAESLLTRSLASQERRGISRHLWRTNNMLGLVAYDAGRYYEAVERHSGAADIALAAGDSVSRAKSRGNVALARIELGDFDAARRLLIEVLPVAQASGQPLFEGRMLVNLGMLAVRTGDPEAAVRYLEAARKPLAQAGDAAGELNRLGQLGTAYSAKGEPGRAIAYLDTALAEARAADQQQEVASNLEHMAGVYRDAGDYTRALGMLDQARAGNERLGLADESAFDLRSAAEIYYELGNRELARKSAESALAIHRSLGDRLDMMHELLLLARLAQEAGDRAGARRLHAEAQRLARVLDAPAARLALAIATARMADFAGDAHGVLRAIEAVNDDLALGGTDTEWEAQWLAGRAEARLGRLNAAEQRQRAAVRAVERVRGEFGSGFLRTSYQAARERVYQDLVDVLLRLSRVEHAFEAADAARGRALVEHLATLRPDGGSSARELAEEERQLLRRIELATEALDRARQRHGTGPGTNRAARMDLDRLGSDLERIRAEYATAITRADERDAGVRPLVGGTQPDVTRVMESLRPGEALLEWFLYPDKLVLFVVTGARVTTFTQSLERPTLATRIRLVRELAGRVVRPDAAAPALEALHEQLLGIVRRTGVLKGSATLVLVTHGELEYVPFAALRDRGNRTLSGRGFCVAAPALGGRPAGAAKPERPGPGRWGRSRVCAVPS
jgi:tetratricopeptide (TPR) repeat protein